MRTPLTLVVVAILSAAPLLGATFTVTKTADTNDGTCDADCSLREAFVAANAAAGPDSVLFSIVGAGCDGAGVCTISPTTALPELTGPTLVDARSQVGALCDQWPPVLKVVLDGSSAGVDVDGLRLSGGASEVRGLVVHSFDEIGILILPPGNGTVVACNLIGTDVSGMNPLGNGDQGIAVGSNDNQIGTSTPHEPNLVSANGAGGILVYDGDGNVLESNFIGTAADVLTPMGNGMEGVTVGAPNTTVGGDLPLARNVISANAAAEIEIRPGETGTILRNNYIGTDGSGNLDLSTAPIGILSSGWGSLIKDNLIAGHDDGIRLISDSLNAVIVGNLIGTDQSGVNTLGGDDLVVRGSGHRIGGTDPGDRNVLHGVLMDGDDNDVQGNYICIGGDGLTPLSDCTNGIRLPGSNNRIGGDTPEARNIITGTQAGVGQPFASTGSNNTIQGNYIGVDATGTLSVGGGDFGVVLDIGDNNLLGGSAPGEGNLISGWGVVGVLARTSTHEIQGNRIGTNALGTAAIPNQHGISAQGGGPVGGIQPGEGNLISGNSAGGILIGSAPGTLVRGNLIGTDATGTLAIPNGIGIEVSRTGGATIGGSATGARNVISGNSGDGILIALDCLPIEPNVDNQILGNFIGVAENGTSPLGNSGDGVAIRSCTLDFPVSGNIIGDGLAGSGNVIASNGGSGINLAGAAVTGTIVRGNFIGTDAMASLDLGNGANGIMVTAGVGQTIGGLSAASGNTIANNGLQGVQVNPVFGICTAKSILGNSIYDNGGLGIDLLAFGEVGGEVTLNDTGDLDSTANGDGPNDLMNYPDLESATTFGGTTTIVGTLESLPDATYRVELFASATCDESGYGEGGLLLASFDTQTDQDGFAPFEEVLPIALLPGEVVTATATDSNGSTSEFSACIDGTTTPTIEVPALGPLGLGLLALLLAVAALRVQSRGRGGRARRAL